MLINQLWVFGWLVCRIIYYLFIMAFFFKDCCEFLRPNLFSAKLGEIILFFNCLVSVGLCWCSFVLLLLLFLHLFVHCLLMTIVSCSDSNTVIFIPVLVEFFCNVSICACVQMLPISGSLFT